jgi:magnesium-transporting ATPase (P-type)
MVFTAFPIIWFATMDYQYNKEELLTNTEHYEIGLKDKCFGTKVFWQWFGLGALKAFMVTWICFYAYEASFRPSGGNSSLYPSGCVVYMAVVFIANLKLFINTNLHHVFGVILVAFSIASYFAILAIENTKLLSFESMLGIFIPIMQHPMTWLTLLFVVWMNYAFDRVFDYIG